MKAGLRRSRTLASRKRVKGLTRQGLYPTRPALEEGSGTLEKDPSGGQQGQGRGGGCKGRLGQRRWGHSVSS